MSEIRISFDVPSYLIVHYYITGISSLILNLFVVYLIVYHSGKLDSYRFYLLAFQISCTLSDLHISIVAQPIGFFPIPAGYGYGIGHYFISSHTGSTIFSFLLSGQIEVLTICFFRKHKAITNLANPLGSSSAVYLCIYAMCVLFTGVFTTSIFISAETREEQLRVLDTLYPSLSANFHALEDFIYYVSNEKMMFCYVLIFGGTLKTAVIINILAFRMVKGLKKVKTRLSTNTLYLHRVTLRCLILQFLTAPIAFIPACVLAIEIWFPNENSQQISRIAFMCMPTHSIFNSIVVVLTYPEFRKKLYFWKRKSMNTTSARVSWLRNSNSNAAN